MAYLPIYTEAFTGCWGSGPPLFWTIKDTLAALRFELILEETSVKIEPKTNEEKSGFQGFCDWNWYAFYLFNFIPFI